MYTYIHRFAFLGWEQSRFARQMPWGIAEFIISSQDLGKHIRVVKLCMAFESGPEWIEELS
jgi:hypothetical protein